MSHPNYNKTDINRAKNINKEANERLVTYLYQLIVVKIIW